MLLECQVYLETLIVKNVESLIMSWIHGKTCQDK